MMFGMFLDVYATSAQLTTLYFCLPSWPAVHSSQDQLLLNFLVISTLITRT